MFILSVCWPAQEYCIWIPAQLQISERFVNINFYWDRVEVTNSLSCVLDFHTRRPLEIPVSSHRYRPKLLLYSHCEDAADPTWCTWTTSFLFPHLMNSFRSQNTIDWSASINPSSSPHSHQTVSLLVQWVFRTISYTLSFTLSYLCSRCVPVNHHSPGRSSNSSHAPSTNQLHIEITTFGLIVKVAQSTGLTEANDLHITSLAIGRTGGRQTHRTTRVIIAQREDAFQIWNGSQDWTHWK